MGLKAFDHVNVRTARLAEMVQWYQDVLGMTSGPRPDFGFGGAWLYLGDKALIHLVEQPEEPLSRDPRIEHFAFSAEGLDAFLSRLQARGIAFRLAEIADFGILQVNIHDPDGNHIHVDFSMAERA